MQEIHTLEEFDAYVSEHGSIRGLVVQGIDLSERAGVVAALDCAGATFLGVRLARESLAHVLDAGAVVFPHLPDLPFDAYRPRLYTQGELLAGWTPGVAGSFARDALDSKIYRWASSRPQGRLPVVDALAERLHDHSIDDALAEHLRDHGDVVAVMGGHSVRRSDGIYRVVAELGRAITRAGWHLATGGGPGAMEAANLGAWLAPQPDGALEESLRLVGEEADFRQVDGYLRAGQRVLDRFPQGAAGLAVPTWFYGHEPTNQFATHVAKYFANSIREEGLLRIATRGVVFAPGAAGTVQEIFQDATQNHYELFDLVSPMVFLGSRFWRDELPAEPLLRRLAEGRRYAPLIGVADTAAEAMDFLAANTPLVPHPDSV